MRGSEGSLEEGGEGDKTCTTNYQMDKKKFNDRKVKIFMIVII
jgi:hypothetical protein